MKNYLIHEWIHKTILKAVIFDMDDDIVKFTEKIAAMDER